MILHEQTVPEDRLSARGEGIRGGGKGDLKAWAKRYTSCFNDHPELSRDLRRHCDPKSIFFNFTDVIDSRL